MLVPTQRSVTNLFLAKSKGSPWVLMKAAQVSSTVWATLTELLLQHGQVDPSLTGVGEFEVVYSFTSNETGCTNTDTLTIMVNDPIVADAGLDTVVCFNAPMLQLEGYYPTIGVLWSGTNAISSNALMDSQAGLINPQLLPPGDYTYLLETGSNVLLFRFCHSYC